VSFSYSVGHVDHSLTLTMDYLNLWEHCYSFTHVSFHTQCKTTRGFRYRQFHCLVALPKKEELDTKIL